MLPEDPWATLCIIDHSHNLCNLLKCCIHWEYPVKKHVTIDQSLSPSGAVMWLGREAWCCGGCGGCGPLQAVVYIREEDGWGRRGGGGQKRGRSRTPSCQDAPGQSSTDEKKKKHQLSVHIRRVMHNCITKLSILPPMTDRINSSFSFSKLVTHVVCVNKSNKVTYEWISKTPSVFLSSWIYETWISWGLSNFPGCLHGKIVWRKFFLKLLHVFTEHLNLFNKAFYPSSVD